MLSSHNKTCIQQFCVAEHDCTDYQHTSEVYVECNIQRLESLNVCLSPVQLFMHWLASYIGLYVLLQAI